MANAESLDQVLSIISTISNECNENSPIHIFIGRDTRPHSLHLSELVLKGAEGMGANVIDLGEVTTPQLHFAVQSANHELSKLIEQRGDAIDKFSREAFTVFKNIDIRKTIDKYHECLAEGFIDYISTLEISNVPNLQMSKLILDASYGVGSISSENFMKVLKGKLDDILVLEKEFSYGGGLINVNKNGLVLDSAKRVAEAISGLELLLRNKAFEGPVNTDCGAELVQKQQTPPCGIDPLKDVDHLMCSFDGDADRIVFHSFKKKLEDSKEFDWVLFDGDKIASIAAVVIVNELNEAFPVANEFSLGCVQTAYANGASTKFLRDQKVPVVFAKTGVKYLHHKAESYDIGIYFEANGHGTVMFSKAILDRLESEIPKLYDVYPLNRQQIAIKRLYAISRFVNQAVGDALSDMLLVLASLKVYFYTS